MADRTSLRTLRRGWWMLSGLIVIVVAVAAFAGDAASTLPAVLPVILTGAAGAGAIAAMLAVQRTTGSTTPADDAEALGEFRARQALQLAIAIAPVLLGTALAAVFGHRASVVTAALVGAAAVAVGMPRDAIIRRVDRRWAERGVEASILRALGRE